jgi:ABC-type lipoprotein release transport system permease subunit
MKDLKTKASKQIEDTNIQVDELNQNLEKMQDVGKEKLKYELELMTWQQDCASLEKAFQEEKYLIEIELARMK